MDKNVLKKFAIESRQELMEKVANKINRYFVDEEFNVNQNGEVYVLVNDKHTLRLTKNEYENRQLLVKRIKEITLEQVIEEAAYTWFNRIIAIRYMEIHDYLPLTKDNQSLGVRVLSSKDNTPDPEIMKISNLINPDLDIEFNKEYYGTIQDNNKRFEYILLLVCKKLGKVIPQVFDGITDYIDILVPDNLLNESGYITKLLKDVSEHNFNQVEIIGWLYQYYNQSEKDRVISAKKAYKKNEIPFATQLFTPDWIVKYMVENSLGKYWIEHGGKTNLINNWKYYIKNDNLMKKNEIDPKDIKCIDPCSGSGHILVYIFEVLFQIYESYGYSKKDITVLILKNNIYGLDIDDRAGQLSILSILLKAREYDKDIFNKDIIKYMNIMSIQESNNISMSVINSIKDEKILNSAIELIDKFKDMKEIGSLLHLEYKDYSPLENYINEDLSIFGIELRNKILPMINVAKILAEKFDIVVTNPPYLGNNLMSNKLKQFITKNYSKVKSDMFSAFIIRMFDFNKQNGYIGTISPYVWMFIKSYYELRKYIVESKSIDSLIQLEYNSFDVACVPVATYIFKNQENNGIIGTYIRLSDFPGVDIQEQKTLEAINDKECKYKYQINQSKFLRIPEIIIGYWLNEKVINLFLGKVAKDYGSSSKGIITGDNNRFLRLWYEVSSSKINFNAENYIDSEKSELKWYPIRKGGAVRKWYGNNEYIINWKNNGYEVIKCANQEGRNSQDYDNNNKFKLSISWTSITISSPTFRIGKNDLSESAGMSYFTDEKYIYSFLALFNSNITKEVLLALAPTMNYTAGSINNIPIKEEIINNNKIIDYCKDCIKISKEDWDSFEVSWDFMKHPLIENKSSYKIKDAFDSWRYNCNKKIELLKENEEKLNKMFIEIYGLQDELKPEVENKDITIRKADGEREIKSLISYAVGCMFGRYSLNKEGLVYAGGKFEDTFEKYKGQNLVDENGQPLPGNNGGWAGVSLADYKYLYDGEKEIELSYSPDIDNIIPLTEENYFGDDIVSRFKKFIEVAYGKETLYENLDFIAETLGKRNGENSEETIRRYFINDFYNDHVKMYQKRPIYWLFDSGKKNGFKCLIYMHRYNEGLVSKIRLDYLHRMQNTYEKELKEIADKLNNDVDLTSKRELSKRQADISAKLQETNEYDEKIAHIADQRIKIDLDDGVVVNYAKFSVKNPKTGKDESILAKIK